MLRRLRSTSNTFRFVRSCSNSANDKSFRRPFQKHHKDFYDEDKLEKEMRRVFDVCHGCRACFNLCNSFPTLFDMVDKSPSQELDSVPSTEFSKVVDDCTLCDMCFMVSCPYVPPHSLDIDFPHLIARYKAVELSKVSENSPKITETDSKTFIWPNENENVEVKPGISRKLSFRKDSIIQNYISQVDFLGNLASKTSVITNALLQTQSPFRKFLESFAGIDARANLPTYVSTDKQLVNSSNNLPSLLPKKQSKRKVVLYGTCISQHNRPDIGLAAKSVLEMNGVEVKVIYDGCCGMPQFERGDFNQVEKQCRHIMNILTPFIADGYDIVSVVASCSLMMKKEWPLLMPDDKDIASLASKTYDISEYMMQIANSDVNIYLGIYKPEDNESFSGSISLHNACHSRAQNIGFKSRDMLNLFKGNNLDIKIVQRCSGHGGIWGTKKEHFDTAMKVGKTAINQVFTQSKNSKHSHFIVSDCPLAAEHLAQGMELKSNDTKPSPNLHPIEIVALIYGVHPSISNNKK